MIKALLLDLDGTLIDTAIDLVESLQMLLERHGRKRIDYDLARPAVPNGSAAIVKAGFGDLHDNEKLENLRVELLDIYQEQLKRNPKLFDGLNKPLRDWESSGKPWGIVTNKPRFLTEPLLAITGIDSRIAILVCGDDLAQRKPHPLPLEYAADQLSLTPQECVYLGDDQRDVIACRAAGMPVLVAAYDYIPDGEDPTQWNADELVAHPSELLAKVSAIAEQSLPVGQ